MKVLFLDIDGVLNSEAWYRSRQPEPWNEVHEFDPDAVFLLRAIVAMTGCVIVISSSWRIGRKLTDFYRLLPGLPIIDMTPELSTGHTRGEEVALWLEQRSDIERYVIVDDSTDFYDHQRRVLMSWKVGLTPALAADIVRHFEVTGAD